MSVKLFYSKNVLNYNPDKSLESQIKGCKKIVIDYKPGDSSIDIFIDEIERFCDKGNSKSLHIDLIHNNFLMGSKVKRRLDKFKTDTEVNSLIKMVVISYSEIDKKLEQLSVICNENDCKIED